MKPILIALNVGENDLVKAPELEEQYAQELGLNVDQVIAISAKLEAELADLSNEEQITYLKDLSIEKTSLERLIQKGFTTLNLITFLTAGEKEVRAWTIHKGDTALIASGVIHTDFMSKFIKADIVDFKDFIEVTGWKNARENGKVRSEGRDYIMKDGDVVEFKIGS
jgi:ribosome-binding ATPase YchF (GTP1/OBG family)